MAKHISMFNHKGGVSKTTTTFNLGWGLSDRGHKVLIVDMDAQCNLTGIVLGNIAVDEDRFDEFFKNRENLTMERISEALIGGTPPDYFMANAEKTRVTNTNHDNLHLLAGNLRITELEQQLSIALKIATGIPMLKNLPGNFHLYMSKVADSIDADYVIYDLSPNVGGLNEVVLMSSDYFIIPTSPDYFCVQAILSLEKNITQWHGEINRFIASNDFNPRNFPIRNKPKFLGAIQQRYRPRNDKPAQSFQKWIDTIRQTINQKLVPSLRKINCVIEEEKIEAALAGSDLQKYDLAQISDFNSLIAISQQLSKPIFALTDDDIKNTGGVFGHAENTMKKSRDNFSETFAELAKRVEMMTS
jgi:cellulose biosynthesis protein BcsQ